MISSILSQPVRVETTGGAVDHDEVGRSGRPRRERPCRKVDRRRTATTVIVTVSAAAGAGDRRWGSRKYVGGGEGKIGHVTRLNS